tara:strand:- start:53 stop:589 length:537 start_codon:yes stop_codon:yes gene_type:complete
MSVVNPATTNTLSFVNYNKIKSILLISNNFNLPNDISENIYYHLLNISTEKIINNWYRHISIHNTNLCQLVCKLNMKDGFYENTHIYYYDLHDINVLRTFRICYKMIDFNISCLAWWSDILNIAYNGHFFYDTTMCKPGDNNLNQAIFTECINIINSLIIKLRLTVVNILGGTYYQNN